MKRIIGLTLAAGLAITGLTACMSDDNSSASKERRTAAIGAEGEAAAGEYQLVIVGVTPPGEAIEVESFSWGATNPSTVVGAGAGTGKVNMNDFHFTKKVDKASPLLLKGVSLGTIHQTATLKLYKAGSPEEKPAVYMTYEMSNVLISSHQHGGGGGVPTEQVSLNYSKMTHTYSGIDAKGAPLAPVKFGWDLAAYKQA